jgi:hypothetical protein
MWVTSQSDLASAWLLHAAHDPDQTRLLKLISIKAPAVIWLYEWYLSEAARHVRARTSA